MKHLYVLSNKIKWSTFQELQKRLVKESGPVAIGIDKALWHLLRKKKIYCYFVESLKDDMGVCLSIPKRYKNYKVVEISSPK